MMHQLDLDTVLPSERVGGSRGPVAVHAAVDKVESIQRSLDGR
jgi:hypothetical protein